MDKPFLLVNNLEVSKEFDDFKDIFLIFYLCFARNN
jgi:hypothetical protein